MAAKITLLKPVKRIKNIQHATQLFQNRRTLWQMLRDVLGGRYKMSLMTNVAVVLGVLYVLFPFDFITDLLPVIGWADDGAVIYFVVKRLQKETQRYNRFKVMERRGF